jgi:hypothetical protein
VLIYSERSTAGWFVVREKYCCLVADKPREHAVSCHTSVRVLEV